MNIIRILLLLPLSFTIVSCQSSQKTDADALLAFKTGFQPNLVFFNWWNGTLPCNFSWTGVVCDSFRVTAVELNGHSLQGTLSSYIGKLDKLQLLSLSGNSVTGSIPTEIGLLSALNGIDLDTNAVNGSIPSEVGLLSSLNWLILQSNKITGTLPTEFGSCSSLVAINVNGNAITGTLPTEIGLLSSSFISIYLYSNKITGTIPSEYGRLSGLIAMMFSSNQITGTLPSELGALSTLEIIALNYNPISGTIPSEFGRLSSLKVIYLYSNAITGTIPTEFGLLSHLEDLLIFNNELTGSLPTEICTLLNISAIVFYNNELTGTIPSEIGLLSNLQSLYLFNNQLSGSFPTDLGHLNALTIMDVYYNDLTGKLPTHIGLLTNLTYLNIGSNKFSGEIPTEIGRLVNVTLLQLSNNRFNGSIPTEFGKLTMLPGLSLYGNYFTSSLPSHLGLLQQLNNIEIFDNFFTGKLPSGWSTLSNLIVFYANVNNFNDTLPSSWGSMFSLHNLDITNSGLTCTLFICNIVYYWNTQTQADSFIIISPPQTQMSPTGVLSVYASLQVSCYSCCLQNIPSLCNDCTEYGCCDEYCLQTAYSSPILQPSFVVSATINPSSLVKSVTANSVGSIEGVAIFSSLLFIGQSNVSYTITFSAPGLKSVTTSSIYVQPCQIRRPNSIQDPLDPYSCVCQYGYYFSSVGSQCLKCPVDTYKNTSNSLSDSLGESACVSCPSFSGTGSSLAVAQTSIRSCVCDALYYSTSSIETSINGPSCAPCSNLGKSVSTCYGANISATSSALAQSGIDVAANYWMTANTSYFKPLPNNWFYITACPPSSTACTGGVGGENCAIGYTGPVCGLCAEGYATLSPYQCARCPARSVSQFLAAFIIVLAIIACVLVVYFSQPSTSSNTSSNIGVDRDGDGDGGGLKSLSKMIDKIGLKIAITHLQIISFTGNFKTTWPTVLTRVFSIPASSSTLSSSVDNIAISCAVNPTLYSRAIVYFFLPFILSAGVLFGFSLVYIGHGDYSELFSSTFYLHVRQGIIALLFIAHPGIIQGLMKSVLCYSVGLESLAVGDVNISCNSSSFKILEGVAATYILIYGLGGLILVYYLLRIDNNKNRQSASSFSFLINGYKKEMNYWDIFTTTKKIIIAVISLFASATLQLFFTVWVLLISVSIVGHFKPYSKETHKNMEKSSTWVLIFTVSVGMLFYNGVLNPNSADGIGVSVLLIILNFVCVLMMLFMSFEFAKFNSSNENNGNRNSNRNEVQMS